MSYALAFSDCYCCGRPFGFNPMRVPSVLVDGDRKPVCAECIEEANPRRVANGLPPIVPHADAYTACHECELGE